MSLLCHVAHKWSPFSLQIAEGRLLEYRWCYRCRKSDFRAVHLTAQKD